ncbi:hypothetical protein NX722_11560 [Endozoicomonas gorgoniicola]|uniref:Uncharacterized protein n=1 Tax=Endozoicomonas gorgoniicola TaxID=1234144 RepID=A0ABT3MV59_9GAMM|nr:hypothetical protein [Endozoicomonas gorgoniicola]MCW7553263.1 hypothetical protein [Endozoicomonas gorgoniicola]
MSLRDLSESLACINPYGGLNIHGNCVHCAIHTADVLVKNTVPHTVDGSLFWLPGLAAGESACFKQTWNRPTLLLAYLIGQGINQVYAAETEDHAYNLVVDSRHYVYVIDSNQQFYRHIRTIRDFIATAHNESVFIRFEDDYANPPGGSNLDIYLWGELSPHWRKIIESSYLGIFQTAGGAYTI